MPVTCYKSYTIREGFSSFYWGLEREIALEQIT